MIRKINKINAMMIYIYNPKVFSPVIGKRFQIALSKTQKFVEFVCNSSKQKYKLKKYNL